MVQGIAQSQARNLSLIGSRNVASWFWVDGSEENSLALPSCSPDQRTTLVCIKYRSVEHCKADGMFECGSIGPYYTILGCGFPQLVLNAVIIVFL